MKLNGQLTGSVTKSLGDNSKDLVTADFVQAEIQRYMPLYQGIAWDSSNDSYHRTGSSGTTFPIQSQMRRCVVADDGTVNYYLSAINSAYKEDGVTPSVLDGTDGQVMVEIPKFYYKHTYSGTTHTWEISQFPLTGFTLHPAFKSDATEFNCAYVAAYEASLDGASKLSSRSGIAAGSIYVSQTRATFRTKAALRGTNWTQMLHDVNSAVQLLYLIEYGSFNSQLMIGSGISNVDDWNTYNNYSPLTATGLSNGIGNASGNTASAIAIHCAAEIANNAYMSYRGIENWYGHIWKWLDGINTNNNRSYVCNNPTNLADDTSSNYTDIGINNINSNGYQATLVNTSRGFLPASVGADGATKITDYYYQNTGWRVAYFGGDACSALVDGGFDLALNHVSSGVDSAIGGRLCFRK